MNKRTVVLIFLGILYFIIFTLYWLQLGFSNIPLREGLYLSTSGIATLAGLFALFTYGFRGQRTVSLVLFTAGIGYWFVGEVLFDYYQYVLNTNPFPSIADIFYTLAYPLLLLGMINEVRISQVNWKKINPATIFLFVFASLCLAGIVFYFGMYQAYNPQMGLLANVIAIGYGGGDLLLIIASMLLLILAWEFRGGSLSRVWLTLFVSFFLTLIADILYAIFTTQYDHQVWFYKSLLDSFWMAGYLTFAYAFFGFGLSIQEAYRKIGKLKKNGKQYS